MQFESEGKLNFSNVSNMSSNSTKTNLINTEIARLYYYNSNEENKNL